MEELMMRMLREKTNLEHFAMCQTPYECDELQDQEEFMKALCFALGTGNPSSTLQQLTLEPVPITKTFLKAVEESHSLKSLCIWDNLEILIESIPKMKNLKRLHIGVYAEDTDRFDKESLFVGIEKNFHLERIGLSVERMYGQDLFTAQDRRRVQTLVPQRNKGLKAFLKSPYSEIYQKVLPEAIELVDKAQDLDSFYSCVSKVLISRSSDNEQQKGLIPTKRKLSE